MFKKIFNRVTVLSLLAGIGLAVILCGVSPALAAVGPPLLTDSTYGVVSGTLANTVAGTNIIGTPAQPVLCYTTAPAVIPGVTGTIVVPCPPQAGLDQGTALGILVGQPCTDLGPGAFNLNAVTIGANPPGTFPPGCYSSGGAMNITTGTTVTLAGPGVFVFRPGDALTTEANTNVIMTGATSCETDVYWAPVGGTTIGANTNFVGNIFRGNAAGLSITLGNSTNLIGRALAFGSTVTTDTNSITVPTCAPFVPAGPVVPLVGKAFLPLTTSAGGIATLTITFINNTAGPATLTADLVDNLPPGMTIVGLPVTTCGGTPPTVTGTSVTLPIGATIPGGTPGTCNVTVHVTALTAGSYTNTIAADALQTDLGNNPVAAVANLPVGAVPPTTVPTLNEWGVIIFMVLAGLGSIYYLRKYRRA